MKLILFITTALALLPPEIGEVEQDTCQVSLKQCIETAIAEGFEVRKHRIFLSHSEEVSKLSVLDLLPSLQFTSDYGFQKSVTFTAAAGLSANALAEGIVLRKGYRAEVIASQAELENAVLETAIGTTADYLSLLLAIQSCKDADSSLSAIRLLRNKTATEVEVGKSSRGTLAEIEAQVASEKASLVKAQGERRSAMMALAGRMNIPPQTQLDIIPPQERYVPSVSELPDEWQIAAYLQYHPRLTAANETLKSSEQQRKVSLIELLPQVEVGIDYANSWNHFVKSEKPYYNVGVRIPILDGSARHLRSKSALTQVKTDHLAIEETLQQLEIQIRGEILEAISSWESYNACKENLNAMELSYHICEAKFDAGAISGSDFITSRKNYLNALAQFWQARYSYIFRMISISIRMNYGKLPQTLSF